MRRSLGLLALLAVLTIALAYAYRWHRRPAPVAGPAEAAGPREARAAPAPLIARAPELAPIPPSASPLPPPDTLVDPLAGTSTPGEARSHEERSLLPDDLIEGAAPAFFAEAWRATGSRQADDAGYRAESEELSDMLREAFVRWPALAADPDLQRIRLLASERCRPVEELGAHLWAYASAGEPAATDGAAAAAGRELERVFAEGRDDLVIAYHAALQANAPDSTQLRRASITLARSHIRRGDFQEAGRAYLSATRPADRISLDAWKGQLALAMRKRWNPEAITAATEILAHAEADDDDKAWALYGRARARIAAKDLYGGMEDCRIAAERHPATVHGQQARGLLEETRAETLRQLAP